ncbi:MAG TPA: homoserine kinase [Tepidiformaceae bacterium]|jgi:homoserine kinase|nr:homoserine kinase [Tepidiformaceae bacterium]
MQPTAITLRVPATSANLGAGFDCLGLALDLQASITVTFRPHEVEPAEDVGEKMVLTAARHTYAKLGRAEPPGMQARYNVAIPLGRGLGASAVARVAGVLAVNEFEGRPLSEGDCLDLASDLEGHGDNACPAMFGGMQVCVEAANGHFLRAACGYPADAAMAILIPDHSMATKEARKALPESYSKADAVHNTGRAALFVAAMASGRLELLDEATDDRIHQRQRAALFPPMFDIFAAAKGAGAHAAWLSGAGSSIAAICPADAGRAVSAAMLATLHNAHMGGRSLVTRISATGATVSKIELAE